MDFFKGCVGKITLIWFLVKIMNLPEEAWHFREFNLFDQEWLKFYNVFYKDFK